MIKSFEAAGKSVEEAIDNALALAGTTIENVEIEVLELGGRGVFGFGKKDARVRVSLESEDELAQILAEPPRASKEKGLQEKQPKAKAPKEQAPKEQVSKEQPIKEQPSKEKAPKEKPAANKPETCPQDEAPLIKEMIRSRPSEGGKGQREHSRGAKGSKAGNNPRGPKPRPAESPSAEGRGAEGRGAEGRSGSEGKGEQGSRRSYYERGYQVREGAEAQALSGEAMSFLEPIFQSLKVQPQLETQVKEGILWLVFSGQSLGTLIGRRGETLNALQYLTNLALNKNRKEHVRLVLDVEGYRAGREDTLVALARKMAEKAYRSGRRVELEPMNPHERRIVHIALQNDRRVDTASQGEEPYRRVVINRRRGDHGQRRRSGNKGEQAANKEKQAANREKLSLSQQLGQEFDSQMEQRN